MPPLARADPETLPLHVLFPESYEASKRMIANDFVFFGSVITASVVLGALVNLVINGAFS